MTGDHGPIVSAEWLLAHQDDPELIIVDARPALGYRMGHIPGSVNSDLSALALPSSRSDVIEAWLDRMRGELRRLGVERGSRVVFYEEITGASAARGVWTLDLLGLGSTAVLDGGLMAWRRVGGGVTREMIERRPSEVDAAPHRDLLATAEELLDAIGTGGEPPIRILDVRSDSEWDAGAIPGAVHLEWTETLNPDGTLRSADELRTLLADVGIDLDDPRPVVTYCSGGYRSSHMYLVLRSLGMSAKNYAPSWGEWGRRRDLPITERVLPAPWDEE